jgi:GTPase SAR1 family protein
MGGKHSKRSDADKAIDRKAKRDATVPTLKFLLLGTGGSGKSTIFKQMRRTHGHRIPELDADSARESSSSSTELIESKSGDESAMSVPVRVTAESVRDMIHRQVIDDIHDLCRYAIELVSGGSSAAHAEWSSEEVLKIVIEIGSDISWADNQSFLTEELAASIDEVWHDPGMKAVFEQRRQSHIMDQTEFFMCRVKDIAKESFKPTFQDYVSVRQRTTGCVDSTLMLKTGSKVVRIILSDVGGQTSERKKWTHFFGGVNVVLWVMSLSGYDQVLFENNAKRVYDDNFEQFGRICHRKEFTETDFVVFLNKIDLFIEKIKEVPFSVYDDSLPPASSHNATEILDFIESRYKTIWRDGLTEVQKVSKCKILYFHQTCATDTKIMDEVVADVQSSLVRRRLEHTGLVSF